MSKRVLGLLSLAAVFLTVWMIGCGAGSSQSPLNTSGGGGSAVPATQTVFVVVLENKNYSDVINSPSMPYFSSLIKWGALATNYYADVHPSIGNYFMLTTGNIETTDDGFSGVISDNNLARAAKAAGKTWKVYAESIPSQGYLGGDQWPYLRRHNPFSFFSDMQSDPSQAGNIVPLSQLSSDLGSGNLPNVAFIIPNAVHDAHSCDQSGSPCDIQTELADADGFLSSVLPGLLNSTSFKNSGLLAITFDESAVDNTHGGGQVVAFFIGSNVKQGYQSTSLYQHENLLRTLCSAAGIQPMGNASAAGPINDIFK